MTTAVKAGGTYLSSQQVDDLKCMLNNADSHQLLAVVAAVHHHGVGQTLHDGALGFAETLGGITSTRVWQVLGVLLFHSNVILQSKAIKVLGFKKILTHRYHIYEKKSCV